MSRTYSRCREHYDLLAQLVRRSTGRVEWRARILTGPDRSNVAAEAKDPDLTTACCSAYDAFLDAVRRGEVRL